MKTSNDAINKLVSEIEAAKGDAAKIRNLAEQLKNVVARQQMDSMPIKFADPVKGQDKCDGCQCDQDDELDAGLTDMVEEAILEDDKDLLIRALSTALMLSAKEAGWINLSSVAHSIWVDQ